MVSAHEPHCYASGSHGMNGKLQVMLGVALKPEAATVVVHMLRLVMRSDVFPRSCSRH